MNNSKPASCSVEECNTGIISRTDSAAPSPPGPQRNAASWTLASLALTMLLPALGTSIANVAMPTFTTVFGATFQQVQWVVLAYLMATTTLVVAVGKAGDLHGRRRVLIAGIALFTAASVACGFAPTLPWLVAARAAQGAGAAVMMALTMAFVSQAVPKAATGRAMGLLGTMSAVGTALGPSLGGLLIHSVGWPFIFLVNVPLGMVAVWLVWRHLPADSKRLDHSAEQPGFDVAGTLVLASGLWAYAMAMTVGRGHFDMINVVLLGAATLGAIVFVQVERRAKPPLIRLAMLHDKSLASRLIASTLVSTVVMATLVTGPFFLARGLQLNAAMVGLVMSVGPLVAAVTGAPAGQLVDRLGAHRVASGALSGMIIGCLALAAMPLGFGVAGYLVGIVVITASYAAFQAANNTGVMADVGADQRGVVSGLLNLSRNLGLITGASLMGAVFAWASSRTSTGASLLESTHAIAQTSAQAGSLAAASSEAMADGLHSTFGIAAMLMLAALALSVAARNSRPSREGRDHRQPLDRPINRP